MSTSLAAVQVAPSYGLLHVPDVDAQEESVTTLVPSRFKTSSLVLHAPDTVLQCGKRSLLYPEEEPVAATVRPFS